MNEFRDLNTKKSGGKLTVANGETLRIEGTGVVEWEVQTSEGTSWVEATDVLYVPGVAKNLISVMSLDKRGFAVQFSKEQVEPISLALIF